MRTVYCQESPSTFKNVTHTFLISQFAVAQRAFTKDNKGKKQLQSVLRQSWLEF